MHAIPLRSIWCVVPQHGDDPGHVGAREYTLHDLSLVLIDVLWGPVEARQPNIFLLVWIPKFGASDLQSWWRASGESFLLLLINQWELVQVLYVERIET